MEYVRSIGLESTETLFVSVYQLDNEASINIFVGINLTPHDIKVIAAH